MSDETQVPALTKKPTVHYAGTVEFYSVVGRDERKHRLATVYSVLDHPRLGFQHVVYTSEVLVEDEDGKTFETRNTIYTPAPTSEEASAVNDEDFEPMCGCGPGNNVNDNLCGA